MRRREEEIERVNVLGVGISAITMAQALAVIDAWISQRQQRYVCITTVYNVMVCQRDPYLRRIHNGAGLTTPDGMPLVWLNRLQGQRHVERVYGPDLMLALCEHSLTRGYRHYFYGGAEGVPERLRARLQARYPGLQVVGTCSPPFRPLAPAEDAEMVAAINASGADIVWVGLGAPRQEYWMAEHVGRIAAPVLLGVGAAFDFHSGTKRQAPLWMQRGGLEWFFRLLMEPRRLWKRYMLYNPLFALLVAQQALTLRGYYARQAAETPDPLDQPGHTRA